MKLLVVVCLCLVACVVAQNYNDRWPDAFTSFWRQYITEDPNQIPPYKDGKPAGPVKIYFGTTWYDYTGTTKKQLQTFPSAAFAGAGCPYDDYIICNTLNINGSVWSWTIDGPNAYNCCAEDPVWVLPPDFALRAYYQGEIDIENHTANWYGVPKENPDHNYAYFQDKKTAAGTNFPAGHWGPHPFNKPGWRWQNYLFFDVNKPPAEVFELPSFCINAPPCPNTNNGTLKAKVNHVEHEKKVQANLSP
eukprot:TRINITY_DN3995_c0_g1_i3.p1 TRINITY_DN3995_c0_g1~~TRINITY_DN3995_c0_g1_i3.p1  ORF type:complete len:248 (-),score=52.53 TRINITY_DN3995_c0_g1_i3:44-787(-)